MIANPARRAFALLWALAFVLGTAGEGFGLHPCPHHDGGASHSAAALPDAHAAHHSAATDHAPAESHDGPCTCGSACQAGTGAALPGGAQLEPTATIVFDEAASLPADVSVAIARPPYFLPFAQAPPRLG